MDKSQCISGKLYVHNFYSDLIIKINSMKLDSLNFTVIKTPKSFEKDPSMYYWLTGATRDVKELYWKEWQPLKNKKSPLPNWW